MSIPQQRSQSHEQEGDIPRMRLVLGPESFWGLGSCKLIATVNRKKRGLSIEWQREQVVTFQSLARNHLLP
jgi:hypothetical protein